MLLSSNVEHLTLYKCNILNQNGSVAALEKIVENLPKVKSISCRLTPTASGISSQTLTELTKIPHFLTLDFLMLRDIPEDIEIDNIYSYMKKNITTTIVLDFAATIPAAYKTRLESIIDEIIEAEEHDYKPPWIEFDGLDEDKLVKLQQIFYQL